VLDQVVDRYIRYAGSHTSYLRNYIKTYGKSATYFIQPKDKSGTEMYSNAFGADKVGFAANSTNYVKKEVHVLVDIDNYQKMETTQDPTVMLLMDTEIKVSPGDRIQYAILGYYYLYEITSPVETFQDLAYRLNLKLITRKSIE